MNIADIIKKHGYDEEFANFLEKLYKELVITYKNEEIIYNALLNTPIISVSNVYDYLSDNNLLTQNNTLVSTGDMKRSSGVYHSNPEIIFDETTNSYKITKIDRVVLVVDLDINKPHSAGTLIHEIGHLVKSYHKEYEIVGDVLIERSGVIECYYQLSYDGHEVKRTLIKEIGVGLEEGLNSLVEEDIGKKIISPTYESTGYKIVSVLASKVLSLNNLEEIILAAEFYQNSEEIENTIGLENYTILKEVMDKIYKLGLLMFSQAFEFEKMQQTSEEINLLIKTEFMGIINKIENDLKLS